jgi:PKHD-type hydroxylase
MLFPIPPRIVFGQDTHAYADKVFTEYEINKILELPEWQNVMNGLVGGSSEAINLQKDKRNSQISWLFPNENTKFIWEKLTNVISDVNSKFFHFDLTGCYEAIQLGIYSGDLQGHYDWHIDAGTSDTHTPRKLSLSLILSDSSEYEGGALELKAESDVPKTLECPRGRIWFFPSYTLHRVAPVTKGIRKSLVLWIGGSHFR